MAQEVLNLIPLYRCAIKLHWLHCNSKVNASIIQYALLYRSIIALPVYDEIYPMVQKSVQNSVKIFNIVNKVSHLAQCTSIVSIFDIFQYALLYCTIAMLVYVEMYPMAGRCLFYAEKQLAPMFHCHVLGLAWLVPPQSMFLHNKCPI